MRTYNKQLFVHKNETFTLDYRLVNNDGSPYVISSLLNSPYFLLSVASSRYSETSEGRYLYNRWLSARELPRFVNTTPLDIGRFYNLDIGSTWKPDDSDKATVEPFSHDSINTIDNEIERFVSVEPPQTDVGKYVLVTINMYNEQHTELIWTRPAWYVITGIEDVTSTETTYKVSLSVKNPNNPYYQYLLYPNGFTDLSGLPAGWYKIDEGSFKYVASVEDNEYMYTFNNQYKYYKNETYIDYSLRLALRFDNNITKDWIEGDYTYSITLLDGNDTFDRLKELARGHGIVVTNKTARELYDELKALGDEQVDEQIDELGPDKGLYGNYSLVLPILVPTKMVVLSDIQGGI